MEEKEIIKSVGAYTKVIKIVCIALFIVATICVIFLATLRKINNNYELDVKNLQDIQSEQYSNYTDLQDKEKKYKDSYIEKYLKDNGLKTETTKGTGYYSYKTYTHYYINDELVEYSAYNARERELDKEANTLIEQDEEYKKVSSELKQANDDYKQAQTNYNQKVDEQEKFSNFYGNMFLPLYFGIRLYILAVLTLIFYFYISKMEITVSNKRVYGKKAFGKRVDLPFDSISAVGTSFLKGIDVGTSSGKIRFKGIKNNEEIHTEISNLLNSRQKEIKYQEKKARILDTIENPAEEIKRYKDLLDNGVITQEEFEAKKKQLLNL